MALLTCFILMALITVCYCDTRCYVCSTQTGQFSNRCGDQFTLTSVDSSYCDGVCFKSRGTRTEGNSPVVEVNRGCETGQREDSCGSAHQNGISVRKCYCSGEICNTAIQTRIPQVQTIISVLLAAFLMKSFAC